MEDLEQKNQIKETVNQLYALRAGLSLVDKEYDKTNDILVNDKKENIEKSQAQILKIEAQNADEEKRSQAVKNRENNKNESIMSQYEAKLKKYKEYKDDYDRRLKEMKNKAKPLAIVFAVLVSCLAVFLPLLLLHLFVIDLEINLLLLWYILFISGMLSGASAIAFVVALGKFYFAWEAFHGVQKDFKGMVKPEYPDIDVLFYKDEKYIESRKRIKENNELISQIKKKSAEKTAECQSIANGISQKGLEMYSLIVREFSQSLPNLDQRDYKHVDLIIYLLETGRAETMKEALQQVDTYVHTEKIVQAIDNASQTISQCIMTNIQSLRNTIEKNTYALGEKTYNVSTMSDNQAAFAKDLNEKLAKTNSSLEMQKALLEKSSVSSAEMANNIEKMRLYADEAYIRNVNKW